jgi:hypothetical protein
MLERLLSFTNPTVVFGQRFDLEKVQISTKDFVSPLEENA